MLIPLLQIGELHSKYLQSGCHSTTNGTNKAALTVSGVEPTDPPIESAFQCIGQQIYPMMSIQHQ